MSHLPRNSTERLQKFVNTHKFSVFITGVVGLAVVLVMISMKIYYSSDAFRLDLSRPEYIELRSEINKGTESKDMFDSQGPVDDQVLEDFLKQYKAESDKVTDAKAFSNDVLSDNQLGIDATSEQN